MSTPTPPADPPRRQAWWIPWAAHRAALPALILTALAIRLAWHLWRSDLTLIEDEAHYWEWSLHPDWSYYSKGPGVAWLIALSTHLFGHTEWAIRFPAAFSAAIAAFGVAALTRWSLPHRPGLTTTAALLFMAIPGPAVAALLMTIDAPFLACWAWAAAFAARALKTGSARAWLALGLTLALGLLFKHTILLLIPGIAWAAWWTKADRPPLQPRLISAALALTALGMLPMLIWNAQHDWPTARHLLGHLNLGLGDTPRTTPWSPLWMPEFLALQLPVCGGVLALALLAHLSTRRSASPERTGLRLSLALSLPPFLFYTAVSLITRAEGNWAMAGAVTLCPAAAWAVLDGVARRHTLTRLIWGVTLLGGVAASIALPATPFLSSRRNFGHLIPASRVTGLREHAAAVQNRLDLIRAETGLEPFVMTDHYGRASQLRFYLPGHPVIYNAASFSGGRRSQHDLWPETDLSNPATVHPLLGRPALLLGGRDNDWSHAFDLTTDLGPLTGEPKPDDRTAYVGLSFRGFPQPTTDRD